MHEEMDPKEKVPGRCHDFSRSQKMYKRVQSGVFEGALGALGAYVVVRSQRDLFKEATKQEVSVAL